MTQFQTLSPNTHKDACINLTKAITDFAQAQVVRLRVPEVGNAACCFPLFFTKEPQHGHWEISALTSLSPEDNLFVDTNRWRGVYTPLAVRTHPIVLTRTDETLALATAAECLSESGQALYDHGEPTVYLRQVEQWLHEDLQGAITTQTFAQTLESLSLIKPVYVQVQRPGAPAQTLDGLYTIDQDALSCLEHNTVAELQQQGYLMAIHSLLMSLFQLNRLIQRHNERAGASEIDKVSLQRR